MSAKRLAIALAHPLAGRGLCGLAMGLGLKFASQTQAILIHLAAAPIIFFLISWVYFRRFNYTRPLPTASIFASLALLMDFFVGALLIQGSFEMFGSLLGAWVPQLLFFPSTWPTGVVTTFTRLPPFVT